MDFVDVGNVGNAADTSGYGAVDYAYSIGKFEVTADQWVAVHSFDANVGNLNDFWSGSEPTAVVSWYEAAKFANWLTSGDALQGAYQFSDATTFTGVNRATALTTYGTIYVLPSEDEWYKAAYLKSDGSGYTAYTTGNATPDGIDFSGDNNYDSVYRDESNFDNGSPLTVGGGTIENNGTYDMGGNVWEWSESAWDSTLNDPGESRVARGSDWSSGFQTMQSVYRSSFNPGFEVSTIGFRVASVSLSVVPEPSSIGMLVIGAMGCVMRRKRG